MAKNILSERIQEIKCKRIKNMAHPIFRGEDIEKITKFRHLAYEWKDKLALQMIRLFRGRFVMITR